MSRAKRGPKARARRNKVLKLAKGFVGGRSKLIRTAQESVDRALAYAFVHRRKKKGDYRALWQVRIGAAAKSETFSYSKMMHGLKLAGIVINRKVLADIAVHAPKDFTSLVTLAKAQVAQPQAA